MSFRKHRKIHLKNKTLFLGLMQIARMNEMLFYGPKQPNEGVFLETEYKHIMSFGYFNKQYVALSNVYYILEYIFFSYFVTSNLKHTLLRCFFRYYAQLSRFSKYKANLTSIKKPFNTYYTNNFIVFSKPARQLFVLFFKRKPIFIFTGGLMRLVLNEKRKCGKRLAKVANSLVKLAATLAVRPSHLDTYYLKLHNIGNLRSKIMYLFYKHRAYKNIYYVVFNLSVIAGAQRFKSRGAIKKYIKKRLNRIK